MSGILNSFNNLVNNGSGKITNAITDLNNTFGSFRSDYFDKLEDQIQVLEEKERKSVLSPDEQSKLNSLRDQLKNLNESVEYKSNVKHRFGIYFFKVKKNDGTANGSDAIISNVIYFPGNTMGSNDLTKPLQMLADYTNQSMLEIDKGLDYINNGSLFPDSSEMQEKQTDFDNNKSYEIVAIRENDELDGEIDLKQGKSEIMNRLQKLADENGTDEKRIEVPTNSAEPLKITNFKK